MEPVSFDLYWSFRSPYCYLAMDRLFVLPQQMNVALRLYHVWPGAMRRKAYFKTLHPNYRTYHGLDSPRIGEYLAIPYARPVPDPLRFDTGSGEPSADQPYIRQLTRLTLAARDLGREHSFLRGLMRLLWSGEVTAWDQGDHLARVAQASQLDFNEVSQVADENADRFDLEVDDNGAKLEAAGHWGVPCMVVDDEPFFGQDRIDMLIWRLRQKGAVDSG